jgi:hypothetical protein
MPVYIWIPKAKGICRRDTETQSFTEKNYRQWYAEKAEKADEVGSNIKREFGLQPLNPPFQI